MILLVQWGKIRASLWDLVAVQSETLPTLERVEIRPQASLHDPVEALPPTEMAVPLSHTTISETGQISSFEAPIL